MTKTPSHAGAAAAERTLERELPAGGLPVGRSIPARPALGDRLTALLLRLWSAILRHPGIWAILLISLITVAPLLRPGYFWGAHDARHDVYFLFEYDRSVLEGNWFPRWGPEWAFGYGYPFWIIYAPLAVFTGEIFHHFGGLDWESSVKAVLALSVVVSGLGMYGFVRSWLGRRAALLAAAVYMLFPYHLVDMFVRAALPESVALAFFPLVLWSLRTTVVRPKAGPVLAGALAYAGLMWTHNLSAVIFTPGLAVYLAALIWWEARPRTKGLEPDEAADGWPASGSKGAGLRPRLRTALTLAGPPFLAVLLGLGLSAGFFIPAAIEGARYVNLTQWFGQYYDPFQHFVYFNQLFNPSWGFGISQPGPDDVALGSLSYQLGALPFLLALIGLVTAGRLARRLRREIWFWGFWGAAAIFLTLGFSAPAWHLPGIPLAQFPWRYLMLAAAPLSVLAGTLVAGPGRLSAGGEPAAPLPWWPTLILVALVALGSYPYLKVEMREPTPQQGPVSYQALMRFERTSDEMTGVTAWVDPVRRPHWSDMADVWISGRQISNRVDYTGIHQDKALAVNAESMGTDYDEIWYYTDFAGKSITFNIFWYPGWRACLLDGRHGKPVRELPIQRENGPLARIVLPVPQGQGFVLLRFEDTPLRKAALGVTYATMILMGLGLLAITGRRVIAGRLPQLPG
ncbi:MAG TPA: 6-pyruvoyl-tetrahydropterin synthase-related protein [Anaerolineae bacterium]